MPENSGPFAGTRIAISGFAYDRSGGWRKASVRPANTSENAFRLGECQVEAGIREILHLAMQVRNR